MIPETTNPPKAINASDQVSDEFARGYVSGMSDSDGSIHLVSGKQVGITFRQARTEVLELTQKYLLQLRILSTLRGPYSQPRRHDMWSLVVHQREEVLRFVREIGFRQPKRARRAQNYLKGRSLYDGEAEGEI